MIPFSRSFRLIERLFPRSSPSTETFPAGVNEIIQPTWDAFANRPGEFQFRTSEVARVGDGTMLLEEPAQGRIQIPVLLVIGTDNAAAFGSAQVRVVDVAASTLDPWKRWDQFTAPIAYYDAVSLAFVSANGRLTVPPYVMHGSQLEITCTAFAGGTNIRAGLYWVDAPGELVNLVSLAVTFGVR